MKIHPNELVILYHGNSDLGKKTLAYAKSISNHINEIEYGKESLTTTIWKDILDMLGLRVKDLLDKSNADYQSKIRGKEFEDEDWLNVLIENSYLIKAPIVIYKNKAILCKSPTDILKI